MRIGVQIGGYVTSAAGRKSLRRTTGLQTGCTSTPFRLRPEGSVASKLEERCGRADPMSQRMHAADLNAQVGMLWCCPCLSQNQLKLPMIYDAFADLSEMVHIATSF